MSNINTFLDRIILGDCLDVMPAIPSGSINLILTDLPYGVTDCHWDRRIDLVRLFCEYRRILSDRGALVLMATQPFATDLVNACRDWFRYDLVWDKEYSVGFLNANRMPLRRHEFALVFYRRLPVYNPQFGAGRPYHAKGGGMKAKGVYKPIQIIATDNDGRRYPTSVLRFPREMNSAKSKKLFHPTQKPFALFEYFVRTYTNPGAVVLDSCLGSGTTALACVANNRHFIGIEKDPDFVDVAEARLSRLRTGLTSAA
ncbi:MAG: hypothetical protein A2Y38_19355 [Spirochaetes bacterium GWB1_59_5]|nr:MAG: hypothetical protein A2Y38_19355 [Spirochaetes bacterium GWB1_59_5]